jgi:hypothetical protein
MRPVAGWSRGTPGKTRAKKGPMMRATAAMAPDFSPTARIPSHSVMIPASGSAMSITATRADSNVPSTTFLKTDGSPRMIHCASAARKPTRKKPAQM